MSASLKVAGRVCTVLFRAQEDALLSSYLAISLCATRSQLKSGDKVGEIG